MNKKLHVLLLLAFGASAISCNKDMTDVDLSGSKEIVLTVKDPLIEAQVTTKTTAITTLPTSLYLAGTTGTTSQTKKWDSVSKTVSSGKISTGYYQTATATSYNYYLSNVAITYASGGNTITADGTSLDVVAGVAKGSTSTTPSVTLNHIFARTGTLSATSSSGYTLSNLSYKLKSNGTNTGTKGTYNIYTGAWSSVTALSEQSITSSSNLFLTPGSYTLTVSGTMTKGDYSSSFSGSVAVTLVAGKVNNINASISGGGATEIVVSTTLTSWGTTTLTPTITL